MALLVTPTRKRYATLLAETICVFASLNCNDPRKLLDLYAPKQPKAFHAILKITLKETNNEWKVKHEEV